jgi:prepilin-type N-terminal cleavage/methylation domain-containing protein
MRNPWKKGFSLVELMVVVAIIGVLAAVAIPTYDHFIYEAKTSEAREKLSTLSHGAASYFHAEHSYGLLIKSRNLYPGCQTEGTSAQNCTNTLTCETLPLQPGQKYTPDSDVWETIPWTRLGFQISGPHYYCYGYTSNITSGSSTFDASATASLSSNDDHTNVDGNTVNGDSQFTVKGDENGRIQPILKKL